MDIPDRIMSFDFSGDQRALNLLCMLMLIARENSVCVSMSALSRHMGMSRQTARTILSKLERQGFISLNDIFLPHARFTDALGRVSDYGVASFGPVQDGIPYPASNGLTNRATLVTINSLTNGMPHSCAMTDNGVTNGLDNRHVCSSVSYDTPSHKEITNGLDNGLTNGCERGKAGLPTNGNSSLPTNGLTNGLDNRSVCSSVSYDTSLHKGVTNGSTNGLNNGCEDGKAGVPTNGTGGQVTNGVTNGLDNRNVCSSASYNTPSRKGVTNGCEGGKTGRPTNSYEVAGAKTLTNGACIQPTDGTSIINSEQTTNGPTFISDNNNPVQPNTFKDVEKKKKKTRSSDNVDSLVPEMRKIIAPEYADIWIKWIRYRKEMKFSTIAVSQVESYKKLVSDSEVLSNKYNMPPVFFFEYIINYSIGNGYKGLIFNESNFKISHYANNTNKCITAGQQANIDAIAQHADLEAGIIVSDNYML